MSNTEQRITIDIAAERESFKRFETTHIGLIQSNKKSADEFTKVKHFELLIEVIKGSYTSGIEKWIECAESSSTFTIGNHLKKREECYTVHGLIMFNTDYPQH